VKYFFLLLFLTACGGGDENVKEDVSCVASSVYEANTFIKKNSSLECRVWTINGEIVDGASYPEFLIGGEV
jgi:hypothetical protein